MCLNDVCKSLQSSRLTLTLFSISIWLGSLDSIRCEAPTLMSLVYDFHHCQMPTTSI